MSGRPNIVSSDPIRSLNDVNSDKLSGVSNSSEYGVSHFVDVGALGVMEMTSPGVGGRQSLPLSGGDVETSVLAALES